MIMIITQSTMMIDLSNQPKHWMTDKNDWLTDLLYLLIGYRNNNQQQSWMVNGDDDGRRVSKKKKNFGRSVGRSVVIFLPLFEDLLPFFPHVKHLYVDNTHSKNNQKKINVG